MNLRSVRKRFLDRLHEAGTELAALTPAVGIEAMLRFYQEERVAHCPPDEDGDLLLFQWGVYDWGDGDHFELNISRQLMTAAGDGNEAVRQLSLTFRYPAEPPLRKLGDGSQWCDDPDAVETFGAILRKSKPFQAVQELPAVVELTFDEA